MTKTSSRKPSPLMVWTVRILALALVVAALIYAPRTFGAIVAGLVVAAWLVLWWVKRKLKKVFEPLASLDNLFEAKLEPTTTAKWHHGELVKETQTRLSSLGFTPIGTFVLSGSIQVEAWRRSDDRMYGVVYDQEFFDPWVDFIAGHGDSAFLTYSTSKMGEGMESPPDKQVRYLPDSPVDELYRQMEQELVGKSLRALPADVEGFAELFQRYQKEHGDWMAARYEAEERRDQAIRESFLESSGWSAVEWDRKQHRVEFVHDQMPLYAIEEFVLDLVMEEDSADGDEYERLKKQLHEACETQPITAAVAAMLEASDPHEAELIAQLEEPVRCDVYLTAEDD